MVETIMQPFPAIRGNLWNSRTIISEFALRIYAWTMRCDILRLKNISESIYVLNRRRRQTTCFIVTDELWSGTRMSQSPVFQRLIQSFMLCWVLHQEHC